MKKRFLAMFLALVMCLALAVPAAAIVGTGSLKLQRETEHFKFYCTDQDLEALDDLEASFEGCYERVTTDLGKEPPNKTRVNIYPDIKSFHAVSNHPSPSDSSVGEARNGVVYMVSPLNPGSYHDYDSVITIAVHEFVHIVIEQFGRRQPSYLNEGLAAYEARQNEYLRSNIQRDMANKALPSLTKLAGFSSTGSDAGKVYTYGYVYVEFIITQFGRDKLIALLEGKNRAQTLGVSDDELNEQWLAYVKEHYVEENPPEPDKPTLPEVIDIPAAGTAVASTQSVLLDGKKVEFQMYAIIDSNGGENNFIKLRDLAQLLNSTKAHFNAGWDEASGQVTITSNTAYVPDGSEGSVPFSGNRAYRKDTVPVRFDGKDVPMTAFKLTDDQGGDYTYYRLRDLGQLLNFNVGWSDAKGVFVETDKPYNPND